MTPVTSFAGANCYLFINTGHGAPERGDNGMIALLKRTVLFIALTIGSSALMALPYIA